MTHGSPQTLAGYTSSGVDQTHQLRRKTYLSGVVTSDKASKTRTVVVTTTTRHPKYGKIVSKRTKCHVHDEHNETRTGDVVEIVSCRPMSKLKRWRLARVISRNEPRVSGEDQRTPSVIRPTLDWQNVSPPLNLLHAAASVAATYSGKQFRESLQCIEIGKTTAFVPSFHHGAQLRITKSEVTEEVLTMGSIHEAKEWRIRDASRGNITLAEVTVWPSLMILHAAWGIAITTNELVDLVSAIQRILPSESILVKFVESDESGSEKSSLGKRFGLTLPYPSAEPRARHDAPVHLIRRFLGNRLKDSDSVKSYALTLESSLGDLTFRFRHQAGETCGLSVTVPAVLEGLELLVILAGHTQPVVMSKPQLDKLLSVAKEFVSAESQKNPTS